MDALFSFPEALEKLREGRILLAFAGRKTYQVVQRNDGLYLLRSETEGLLLSLDDFTRLFSDCQFKIDAESEDEETVDPKKDEEYYSWRQ